MKKLSNQAKMIIILITNFIIITSIFTYQDYQKNKAEFAYKSQFQLITEDINNEFSKFITDSKNIIDHNINRYPDNDYIIYDSGHVEYISNSNNYYFTIVDNLDNDYYPESPENKIFFNNISYTEFKRISEYITNAFNENRTPIISYTYDYVVDYLLFLKIDDEIFVNGDPEQAITAPLIKLVTPFIDYENSSRQDPYCYTGDLEVYEYLEKFFKDTIKNIAPLDEFKETGLYHLTNPKDSPIDQIDYINNETNERDILNVSYYFQKLSAEYGKFYDEKINFYDDPYYIVWVQYDEPHEDYTFFTYFSSHYFNYLILIFLLGVSCFVIKKTIVNKEIVESVEPIEEKEIEIENNEIKDEINLDEIISDLINQSNNLLLFKKITIDYHSDNAIIYGNKEELSFVINKFYNFMIHHSRLGDTFIIKIAEHRLSFSYAQAKIEHLNELDDCIEILKKHKYIYEINRESISFKGWG